jgi:hypothetical protein
MSVVMAVGALLVGLVVGGLGPRAQVRALEKQLAEAEECPTSTMGTELANVFRGRPWDGDRPPPAPAPVPDPVPEAPEPEPEEEGGFQITFGDDGGEDPESMTKEDIDQQLVLAREAMELRYAQAREALIQDADPTEEQLAAIDDAMAMMNDDLAALATELTAVINNGEEPTRRETMEFAADTLDVLLGAEDSLTAALSEDQVAELQPESLDPMSYVDPAIVDILGQLNR